jgi:hypothetical protein
MSALAGIIATLVACPVPSKISAPVSACVPRRFTAADKLGILHAADACAEPGHLRRRPRMSWRGLFNIMTTGPVSPQLLNNLCNTPVWRPCPTLVGQSTLRWHRCVLPCAILRAAKTTADAYFDGPPVKACDKPLATTPPLRDNGFVGTPDITADCRQARMQVRGWQGSWQSRTAAM